MIDGFRPPRKHGIAVAAKVTQQAIMRQHSSRSTERPPCCRRRGNEPIV